MVMVFAGAAVSVLLTASAPSAPQGQVVTTTGYAAVQAQDPPAARDRAIQDALRRAVEQALGARVASKTLTRDFLLVSDAVLSESRGYVLWYDVLSDHTEGELREVRIRAEVAAHTLQDDLGGLLAALRLAGNPRIFVQLSERFAAVEHEARRVSFRVAETAFVQALTDHGLDVIDRAVVLDRGTGEVPEGAALMRAVERAGVELLVVGQAVVTPMGAASKERLSAMGATITARVIDVTTGDILATATELRTDADGDPVQAGLAALERASLAAVGALLTGVAERMSRETASARIEVVVTGLASFKDYREVSRLLRAAPGAHKVTERTFEAHRGAFEVILRGSTEDLGRALNGEVVLGGVLAVTGRSQRQLRMGLQR